MVGSVTVLVALTMQLVVAEVYYPTPAPTPSPVTTTTMATTTTTLSPDLTTTVAPVILMNALMDNMRHIMSMYPSVPLMNAPAGYPVAPNYPPMSSNHYYEAPPPVTPAMPVYNNYYMPPAPVYGGMPPSVPTNYGGMPPSMLMNYGGMPPSMPMNYAANQGYGVSNNYVTTARPASYGAMPNQYGSSYGSFGPSSIYGIGSRPTGAYYGNGYQQQLPHNYNNVGYSNNQPSYPMNIAFHGPAW